MLVRENANERFADLRRQRRLGTPEESERPRRGGEWEAFPWIVGF